MRCVLCETLDLILSYFSNLPSVRLQRTPPATLHPTTTSQPTSRVSLFFLDPAPLAQASTSRPSPPRASASCLAGDSTPLVGVAAAGDSGLNGPNETPDEARSAEEGLSPGLSDLGGVQLFGSLEWLGESLSGGASRNSTQSRWRIPTAAACSTDALLGSCSIASPFGRAMRADCSTASAQAWVPTPSSRHFPDWPTPSALTQLQGARRASEGRRH